MESGDRSLVPGITVFRDVEISMSDGTRLLADIYRPDDEAEYPVILMRLPYDKTQAMNVAYAHPSWYARQGYIVVLQDVRGRFASEGEWVPFQYEAEDGKVAIEWAARLPGSTGKVGTYGFSYGGATQLLAAAQEPNGLHAMSPAMTGSAYHDGWTYNQGALALGFVASWAVSLGIDSARRRGDEGAMAAFGMAMNAMMDWHWSLPLNGYQALDNVDTSYFFDWLDHPTSDDYWNEWSIQRDYSRIDAAGLHVAGWYDVFLDGTIRNYNGLRASAGSESARSNQRLVIGPWYHIPWNPVASLRPDECSPAMVDDLQIAWFDQHLKGKSSDLLDAPVTVWIMGEERWRRFNEWPPAESSALNLYLRSEGRANSSFGDGYLSQHLPGNDPVDVYTYDPSIPNLSAGGHSCCFPFLAPMGPADQAEREQWNSVLVYTSEPLDSDTVVIGDVDIVLYAATDGFDTDWTARLCEVNSDGVSINIQEGIVRARYRDSLSEPTLLVPNQIYEYRIALGAVGHQFKAGTSIRLTIASSDFPQWDRNLNTGGELFGEGASEARVATQVVYHDAQRPSHLRLPVLVD